MKNKLLLLAGSSTFSLIALVLLFIFVSPKTLGGISLLIVLPLVAVTISGILTIMGFYGRLIYTKNESYFQNFKISFRQGILLSLYCCLLLLFSFLRIGTLAISSMLLLVFVFIELFLRGE